MNTNMRRCVCICLIIVFCTPFCLPFFAFALLIMYALYQLKYFFKKYIYNGSTFTESWLGLLLIMKLSLEL